METREVLRKLNDLKSVINNFLNVGYRYKDNWKNSIINSLEELKEKEEIADLYIANDIAIFYERIIKAHSSQIDTIIKEMDIINKIEQEIKKHIPLCYGNLRLGYEDYKMKVLLWYENENNQNIIAYMAGSFYTDQEYRTFLSNLQKGINNICFERAENRYDSIHDLRTIKDGYISRVKKAINQNTQDGYHAEIHLDSGRLFILMQDDNPVDAIYNWIVKNTQAAVLEEWKTYLYNQLLEGGHIIECKGIDYTGIGIKGIVLSDEVDTELIRVIRYEGLKIGDIKIPRKPVELDASMSFIDAMNKYIIPEITSRETLYQVGDSFSPLIETPIIFKQGCKLKKSHLLPKQKVMTQGLLNAVKDGRNGVFLNGGMGIGKTYMAIKLSNAVIKEHFKRDYGRIAVYCQGHLIPKWERQFKEALPNVPLKFIKIDGYKDVIKLKKGKPEGIEVYLLPKDKVKRKYLEEYAANKCKFELSAKASEFLKINKGSDKHIFKVNEIKMSELKVIARKLEKANKTWVCVYKEIFDKDGNVIEYKVATTSEKLKEIFGITNRAYDFIIKDLAEIEKYIEIIEEEYKEKCIIEKTLQNGLVCPICGGFIYNKMDQQLSEDEYDCNVWISPGTKSDNNKKCINYIKADGTPLMAFETKKIIKREIEYFITPNKQKYSYYDEEDEPITDQETLVKIKSGYYKEPYKIALKKCGTSHWTAIDKKGYRTVNAIDMLERKFGKKFFDVNISDECHLYSAQSSQGETFAKLCRMSKVNLALTGTLTGGKASHLFYMLYRMIPEKMSKVYKYNEVAKFIDHYGRRKKVTKEYDSNDKYNKSGQGKVSSSGWNEIPGISPMLYSHFLSDIMVSRKIEDMNYDMPELKFFKHEIPLSSELKIGYDKLKDDLMGFMKKNKELNLGGTYLNVLLSYPDMPLNEPLYYEDMLISNPPVIDIENIILPKEQKLVETIKRELNQGRRTVVYITYTGTKKIDKRVEKILSKEGIKVAVLKSTVNTEKREQWIEDRYNEGVEVIITNPKLVQTGLDIIGYPTLYFYEVDYDVRVTRQAESRAWRPNQEKECRVYYSYYADTLQYDALKLIGSKKKASLALEGVFAEDILSDMGDIGDTGAAALYKALLGKVKLKEDDLDFFSNEQEIEIIEVEPEKAETIQKQQEKSATQLSLFTVTEEMVARTKKKKKKVAVGQISFFEI